MSITVKVDAEATARAQLRGQLKNAAVSSLVLCLLFVALPLLRQLILLLAGTGHDATYPAPSSIPDREWEGVYGALIFSAIGVTQLVLISTVHTAAVGVRGRSTVRLQVGWGLGLVGVVGWCAAATGARTMFSQVATNLTETGAEPSAQSAALWAVNIVGGGSLLLGGVGTCGWLLLLATDRRPALLGRTAAIIVGVLAVAILFSEVGLVLFAAQFAFILVFAALALAFRRQKRNLNAATGEAVRVE